MVKKKRSTTSSTTAKKKKKTTASATTAKKGKGKKTKSSTATKTTRISKALTRSQQIAFIAEQTSLSKKDVTAVLECFEPMIASHLRGPGQITLAGLMKVVAIRKPATKARKGVNPFTGEPTVFKAKPARNVVRIRPLKKVKDLVA
ncbi:MAG TPA: HU family DNA-binding protein [Gammaproteobacteria bacterium]|nr:HU family DNA-binding protein [Gammaproteobacteria bacterium]